MSSRRIIENALGQPLQSHWHHPEGEPTGLVVIAPAIGITQSYYQALAAWLAKQGLLAVTFDYHGVGESLRGPLRQVRSNVLDWARHDCGAVLEIVRETGPQLPLYWIGHSLGGQIVPFIPGNQRIDKLITVACGCGYWKDNATDTYGKALLLWYGLVPVLTPLFGHFPGKRLNIIGDLPRNVVWQWRQWCLTPRYAAGVSAEHQALYSAFSRPIRGLAFLDDELISPTNIRTLHASFDQAPVQVKFIDPAAEGLPKVGHLGFFRRQFEASLWPRLLEEMDLAVEEPERLSVSRG